MNSRTGRLSLSALVTACAAVIVSGATGVASAPASSASSPNEAGYTATVSGSTFLLKTQFTVPTLTCSTAQAGIEPGAYLKTPTSVTGGGIFIACSGGIAGYEALATINNTRSALSTLRVAPGDDIVIRVAVSAAATTVAVVDATKAARQSLSGAGSAPTELLVGDAAVLSSGGGNLAVPSFGKIRFRTTTLNKVDLGASSPTAVNMVNSASVVQITTAKLSVTGAAFKTTFAHS
jgi:Peptidase A4 family